MSLIKNEDGSYTVNATKLDVKNEGNQIWKSLPVKAILDDAESSFRTKLKEGVVYSNWGRLSLSEDMTGVDLFKHYIQTNLEDICAVILDCVVNEDNIVEVSFRPYGSKGHLLQTLIDEGGTPTFGIRSIGTVSYNKENTEIVSVKEIISFDVINLESTNLENTVITQTPVSGDTPGVTAVKYYSTPLGLMDFTDCFNK